MRNEDFGPINTPLQPVGSALAQSDCLCVQSRSFMRPNPTGCLGKYVAALLLAQQLVHEIFQLRPERVTGGNYPDRPAIFHHRHVPESALRT